MSTIDIVAAGLHGQDAIAAGPRWSGVDASRAIGSDRDVLTWSQAHERTRMIAAKLGTLRGALGVVTDLVNDISAAVEQAWADRYDQVLGYATFEDFCRERFGDLGLIRLPAPERAELVLSLTGAAVEESRCSIRGAARLMGIADQTARAAIAKSRPKRLALVAAPMEATVVVESDDVATVVGEVLPRSVSLLLLDALAAAGPDGLTIPEAIAVIGRGYGTTSSVLHRLEVAGHAERTNVKRGTFYPYVLASFLV